MHNEDIDTDAYIMCNGDKLVIAFRGTEFTLVDGVGIDDIITDLDVKDGDTIFCLLWSRIFFFKSKLYGWHKNPYKKIDLHQSQFDLNTVTLKIASQCLFTEDSSSNMLLFVK